MSFDKWWKDNSYKYPQADYARDGHEEVARAAWDAQQAKIDRLKAPRAELEPQDDADFGHAMGLDGSDQ